MQWLADRHNRCVIKLPAGEWIQVEEKAGFHVVLCSPTEKQLVLFTHPDENVTVKVWNDLLGQIKAGELLLEIHKPPELDTDKLTKVGFTETQTHPLPPFHPQSGWTSEEEEE